MFGDAQNGKNQPAMPKPSNIEIVFVCTLNEFYNGANKVVKYKREKLRHDAKSTEIVEETLQVQVKPGFSEETVLELKEQGNESLGHPRSSVFIKFKQAAHSNFKRIKGNDLIYTHKISLVDSLKGDPVVFQHFDGRTVSVGIDSLISPQSVKIVRGEGMPVHKENADSEVQVLGLERMEKGDLYIRFEIEFPTELREEQKSQLLEVLKGERS